MSPTTGIRFRTSPGVDGYFLSINGRWKAREKPGAGVTLTDTWGRAQFAGNEDQRWCRCASWAEARALAAAFPS
jgi:hypothetical protein